MLLQRGLTKQVDLQINYLWQLQHKRLSKMSFLRTDDGSEADTDTEDDNTPITPPSNVLANATDTALKGPALGPGLFVETVIKSYTAWLEREIVNGPIGQRLRDNVKARASGSGQRVPPGKVLIAGALPPLVEDEMLPRIPEKYVERLEEEHEKTHRMLARSEQSGSKPAWRSSPRPDRSPHRTDKAVVDNLEVDISTLSTSDRPVTPISGSSVFSRTSSLFDIPFNIGSSLHSSLSDPTSPTKPSSSSSKTSIESLLKHDPPLCTLPVRVSMTNHFNTLLQSYCDFHPDIFSFVDITKSILSKDAESGWNSSKYGEVNRLTWACPVDPTNIHPVWEVTLPLWLEALGQQGVPVEGFRVSNSAEETFRAYELDKKRRTGCISSSKAGRGG